MQIVVPNGRTHYRRELDAMHRLRHRVAVEQWGWRIPGIIPGYDKDQFDTDKTIYFLAFAADGENPVGCARLNPTTEPHMLSEVFPRLCDISGVERGSDVYEFSRFIVDHKRLSRPDRLHVIGRIEFAITKFCLAANIRRLTWVSYEGVYRHGAAIWDTEPLGRPHYFEEDDATYIAAASMMTDTGLDRIRSIFNFRAIEPPCVMRADWSAAATFLAPSRCAEPAT